MDKVKVRGTDIVIPQGSCASCGGPPSPDRFMVLKIRYGVFRRDFPFPACDHCATLFEAYLRRRYDTVLTMLVLLFAGLACSLAVEVFVPPYVTLPEQGRQATEVFVGSVVDAILVAGIVAFLVGFPLVGRIANRLSLRSLGEAKPPLEIIHLSPPLGASWFDPDKLDWTFLFENETYAMRFRSLNGSIVREPR